MTVYSNSVSSMHLTGGELRELEKLLTKGSTNPDFNVSFEHDNFKYTLDSSDEFIKKPDLPKFSTNYQIKMASEEGKIRISSKESLGGGRVRISGDTDWVRNKKNEVNDWISENRNILRTHLSKVVSGIWVLEGIMLFLLDATTPDSNSALSTEEAILSISILVSIIGFPLFILELVDFFYPYSLLKQNESIEYRHRIKSLSKYVLLILTIVGGIAGFVTIFQSL